MLTNPESSGIVNHAFGNNNSNNAHATVVQLVVRHLAKVEVAGSSPVCRFFILFFCGCSSMVEHQPSKLDTWVRFPSPAFFVTVYAYVLVYRFHACMKIRLHEHAKGAVTFFVFTGNCVCKFYMQSAGNHGIVEIS